MDLSMTGGPWNRSKVGVHGVLAHVFFIWIQSNHRIEFSNLSFPIAHFPAGRLTCANSGENFVADLPFCEFMNGGRQNFYQGWNVPYHITPPISGPSRAPTYHIRPRLTISGPMYIKLGYGAPFVKILFRANPCLFFHYL